jgi:hypothetical protein
MLEGGSIRRVANDFKIRGFKHSSDSQPQKGNKMKPAIADKNTKPYLTNLTLLSQTDFANFVDAYYSTIGIKRMTSREAKLLTGVIEPQK